MEIKSREQMIARIAEVCGVPYVSPEADAKYRIEQKVRAEAEAKAKADAEKAAADAAAAEAMLNAAVTAELAANPVT